MTEPSDAHRYDVEATADLTDTGTRVLKEGETFAVFNRSGEIQSHPKTELGVFHAGTRHLSSFTLTLGDQRLLLLNSDVGRDNVLLTVDLMNPELVSGEEIIHHGTLHAVRHQFLRGGVLHQRLVVTSYAPVTVTLPLTIFFDADFSDIFEVRGTERKKRGRILPGHTTESTVTLCYLGLDDVERRTIVSFSITPDQLDTKHARFATSIPPHGRYELEIAVECLERADKLSKQPNYDQALQETRDILRRLELSDTRIHSSNELMNVWLNRSLADLRMMETIKETGRYPYAGVPWFSTSFGRDGILTALQALWVSPDLARGVLTFLASTQAQALDAASDAEPGKIVHETRDGEMARLNEIPFGRYYGSVDSTPLFLMLAAAYFDASGDLVFMRELWPHLVLGLRWIDEYGDRDGDGFVEYARQTEQGLQQQGWKDSHDSVFHADGSDAKGPIALCEVQGYVYAAKQGLAEVAEALGEPDVAERLKKEAAILRKNFDLAFWCENINSYALALDGQKKQCAVSTSNAGHCLFTGIAFDDKAGRVAQTLLSEELFSGWGIRTLSTRERRYNPMAYHNGSIWPHDNAVVADGLARYGYKDEATRIFSGMFDTSLHVDLHRLPELFCGFPKGQAGPTLYPVACAPQAWAAAAVCLLLRAALGLRVDARNNRIELHQPRLPAFLERLDVTGLRVGSDAIDLEFSRREDDVVVNVLARSGAISVAILK